MINPNAMTHYRQTARVREKAEQERLAQRRAQAWDVARQAAAFLKAEFGATRVVVFGSLLDSRLFHPRSDVDLAVWGLNERDYYRAVSHLLDLDPDISVDLIEFEQTQPALRAVIQESGVVL